MRQQCAASLVVWYDAVTTEGFLIWQNALNGFNRPFFEATDAIFLNYAWQVPLSEPRQAQRSWQGCNPSASPGRPATSCRYVMQACTPAAAAAAAGERRRDVFCGIDVFGRGTYAGGQLNSDVAAATARDGGGAPLRQRVRISMLPEVVGL